MAIRCVFVVFFGVFFTFRLDLLEQLLGASERDYRGVGREQVLRLIGLRVAIVDWMRDLDGSTLIRHRRRWL